MRALEQVVEEMEEANLNLEMILERRNGK